MSRIACPRCSKRVVGYGPQGCSYCVKRDAKAARAAGRIPQALPLSWQLFYAGAILAACWFIYTAL